MEQIFGSKIGKRELAALRSLLESHAAVGVDFYVDGAARKQFATVSLVWPASKVGTESCCAPWVISERVVGRPQFQALVRTLLLEGRATKALHSVGEVARWMATNGLENAIAGVRHVVDLQLFFERAIDPKIRCATLTQILETGCGGSETAKSSTAQDLYRSMLTEQLTSTKDNSTSGCIKSKQSSPLVQILLQHSVQRAHLCLVCFERVVTPRCAVSQLESPVMTLKEFVMLTQRRFKNVKDLAPRRSLIWFTKSSKFAPRSLELLFDCGSIQSTIPRVKRHCDAEPLLAVLPPSLCESIVAIEEFEDRLISITVDVGSKPKAYIADASGDIECVDLHKSHSPTPSKLFGAFRKKAIVDDGEISHEDLSNILLLAGGDAAIDETNRIGLHRQLHRIAVVRNNAGEIVGLTMRVGRTIQFMSNVIMDLLLNPNLQDKSILVIGRAGSGKTSLLRDIARCLSSGRERVCIVDTTNEIGGDGSLMHPSVDRATRFMVKSLNHNADAIVECVQNHLVGTLVVDEINSERDAKAIAFAKRHCRRRVVAGCAVEDLEQLVDDPELNQLVGGIQTAHQDSVIDQKRTKAGRRIAQPVVDVVVQLDASCFGRCRIVWNVAKAVDDLLSGREYEFETRFQSPDVLGIQVSHH